MTIGVVAVGKLDSTVLFRIRDGLAQIFPETKVVIVGESLPLPEKAFDKRRGQYRSNQILSAIQSYALKKELDRFLGVVDEDIFVPELNFVFGEAAFPGKSALISLWRLKPEFYKDPRNLEVLAERALKEAVHEVGHTLGLKHCTRPSCVMYFSNSIFDTDRKQSLFCDNCYLEAVIAINSLK